MTTDSFTDLSDEQLIARVHSLTDAERRSTARLIASLAEFDARRLYLREGCASLFTYCTQVLHFSEHAAYGRIEAPRAARRFPTILDMLADGRVTLTAVGLLARHLTGDNHEHILAAARYKTKREVELLVATLRPQPAVPATIRKLPAPRPAAITAVAQDLLTSTPASGVSQRVTTEARPVDRPKPISVLSPLAPERYKLQLTLSAESYTLLRRARDLMRHSVPSGDLATIVERALTVLVRELEKTKLGATDHPRQYRSRIAPSRRIPAEVRRRVWERDDGQCAFVGTQGRCTERGFLEFHHVVPYADGGESVVDNLQVRCRAHNHYEAQRWSGTLFAREDREISSGALLPGGKTTRSWTEHVTTFSTSHEVERQPVWMDTQ